MANEIVASCPVARVVRVCCKKGQQQLGRGEGSVKPANIAGKNTALLIPNVSSRSMESGSSCCRCCSYACCAPLPFSPSPLFVTLLLLACSSSPPSPSLCTCFCGRSPRPASVSLANSLATFSYYFLFYRVAASPRLPPPSLPLSLVLPRLARCNGCAASGSCCRKNNSTAATENSLVVDLLFI